MADPKKVGMTGLLDLAPSQQWGMGLLALSDGLNQMAGMGNTNQFQQGFQQQLLMDKMRKEKEAQMRQAALTQRLARENPDMAPWIQAYGLEGAKAYQQFQAGPDKNVWEEKRDALVQSGVDPDTALGIATGVYRTKSYTDKFGNPVAEIVDLRTGQGIGQLTGPAAAAVGGEPSPQAVAGPGPAASQNAITGVPPRLEALIVANGGNLPQELETHRGPITEDMYKSLERKYLNVVDGVEEEALPKVDFSEGTGASGFFGNIANTAADLAGLGLPYEEAEKAALEFKTVGNEAISLSLDTEGRPTNFTRQLQSELNVQPNSLFEGDARAKNKVENLITTFEADLEAQQRIMADDKTGVTRRNQAAVRAVKVEKLLNRLRNIEKYFGVAVDVPGAPDVGAEFTVDDVPVKRLK